jgi:hypothetical protein
VFQRKLAASNNVSSEENSVRYFNVGQMKASAETYMEIKYSETSFFLVRTVEETQRCDRRVHKLKRTCFLNYIVTD